MPQNQITSAGMNYKYGKKKHIKPIKGFVDRRKEKEIKKKGLNNE